MQTNKSGVLVVDRVIQRIYTGVVRGDAYRLKTAAPFLVVLLMAVGCGDVSNTDAEPFDPAKAAQVWNTADKTWDAEELEILESGKILYRGRCAGCHQLSGAGSTTIGAPALKGSAVARGSADILIKTVLFGRGSMPAFRNSLDNAGLARILSYVRNAWGNNMQEVVPVSRVVALRAAGN